MVTSGKVDAVVTTVPHYLHPEMAIYALAHGVHVLVDKPAGVYAKQVREMNEFAATKPELTFAIMFNQRTNNLYQRLKEIVSSGELGSIRRTNWIINSWWRPQSYYDQSEWRATWGGEGGGVLVNQAPHQLDLWQWICGMPKAISAKVIYGAHRDIAVDNDVTAVADYGNGATGVFVTCTHDVIGTDRLEIDLDGGKIVVEKSKTATVSRLNKTGRGHERHDDHDAGRQDGDGRQARRTAHHRGDRGRRRLGHAAPDGDGKLCREHPGRHALDRARGGWHQRRRARERDPALQLAG